MRILRRFTFPVLCVFYLVACNIAKTIPVEALGDTPTGVTTRFFFPTSGSNAEAYLTRPAGPGPFPLMILLHGHTFESIGGAESVVPEAQGFASDLCYAGLAVSLPGYGATEVPPGLDPEITINVVLDAVSLVKKLPWIDSKRIYLYGFSRGAFFASLPANRIEGIKGVVLQSGAYDLNRFYQDTLWFRSLLNPNGEQNPKLISILPQVPTWRAPTLVLHGGKDLLVSVQQANLLSESLEGANKPYRFVLYPNDGHRLPVEDVRRKATAFLAETSDTSGLSSPRSRLDDFLSEAVFFYLLVKRTLCDAELLGGLSEIAAARVNCCLDHVALNAFESCKDASRFCAGQISRGSGRYELRRKIYDCDGSSMCSPSPWAV
jgi:pimeloyl-ACP methyl ester carboxylesterase